LKNILVLVKYNPLLTIIGTKSIYIVSTTNF